MPLGKREGGSGDKGELHNIHHGTYGFSTYSCFNYEKCFNMKEKDYVTKFGRERFAVGY